MARQVTSGTPGRTRHYLLPRARAFLYPALVTAGLIFASLLVLQVAGFRRALMPGGLSSRHAILTGRCQECHLESGGTSNTRCQRCHDPGGAGRLAHAEHVFFGDPDAGKAAASPDLACATCHVEHRGAAAAITTVPQSQCEECHFQNFARHPEFRLLRVAFPRPSAGLAFSHGASPDWQGHILEVMQKRKKTTPIETCAQCHARSVQGKDFEPLSFDKHCADCHTGPKELFVRGVRAEDVETVEALRRRAGESAERWMLREQDFVLADGVLAKAEGTVAHKDEWLLHNLRRLRRQIDPKGYDAELARLKAQENTLTRQLALATVPAELDLPALKERAAIFEVELEEVEKRVHEETVALAASRATTRLDEIEAAAAALGDLGSRDEVRRLQAAAPKARGKSVAWGQALSEADLNARRAQLLSVVEAIEAADPARKEETARLRQRLEQLAPGGSDLGALLRSRNQRRSNLDRIVDEIRLRTAGTPPAQALSDADRAALQRGLDETTTAIGLLEAVPEPPPLTAEEIAHKRQAVAALTESCRACHTVSEAGLLAPVRAARTRLTRATFSHRAHLVDPGVTCLKCHAAVTQSHSARDVSFDGVVSCRECHRPLGERQDCQRCHRYHPAGAS